MNGFTIIILTATYFMINVIITITIKDILVSKREVIKMIFFGLPITLWFWKYGD